MEQIAYADETGIDTYLYREYGYTLRGQKFHTAISGRRYKWDGLATARLAQKIFSPLEHSGIINSGLFESWFEKWLLPELSPEAGIVMDKGSFYRKAQLMGVA